MLFNKKSKLTAALTLFATLAGSVYAFAGDWEDCSQPYSSDTVDGRASAIAACDRLIRSGQLNRKRLAVVYRNRAFNWLTQEDTDNAMRDFNRAIELDPSEATNFLGRGIMYINMRKNDLAFPDLNRAIELDPRLPDARNSRGNILKDRGLYDQAIDDYTRAIDLDSGTNYFFANRGRTFLLMKKYELAIADLTTAIKMGFNLASIHHSLGNAYAASGNGEQAIASFTRAIERDDSSSAEYYNSRAWALFKAGRSAKGLPDAEKAVELQPDSGGIVDTLAHIYEALGRKQEAVVQYRRALKLNPNIKESQEGLKRLGATQ